MTWIVQITDQPHGTEITREFMRLAREVQRCPLNWLQY